MLGDSVTTSAAIAGHILFSVYAIRGKLLQIVGSHHTNVQGHIPCEMITMQLELRQGSQAAQSVWNRAGQEILLESKNL
jgi:hypothetical protein